MVDQNVEPHLPGCMSHSDTFPTGSQEIGFNTLNSVHPSVEINNNIFCGHSLPFTNLRITITAEKCAVNTV